MLTRMVNCLRFGISQQLTKPNLMALIRIQKRNHCTAEYHPFYKMAVQVLPVLHDNYMYLIADKTSREAAIVDPVKPQSVMQAAKMLGVNISSVLTTHYHWDHAGGNIELVQMNPTLKVYGGDDRIGALTHKVAHNTTFRIGGLHVLCLSTPCHTAGDVCYYVSDHDNVNQSALFSGDTLFLGGCGSFMEGTADQMYSALIEILSQLPDETKVFCGHEYTLRNLMFASHVEPENKAVKNKYKWCHARRKEGKPTVPSTIGEEKTYNPFMRVLEPSVMQFAKARNGKEAMKNIRLEKDCFKVT